MSFQIITPVIGNQAITTTSTTQQHDLGYEVQAKDATYGAGTFVYAQGCANTAVGSWAHINPDDYSTTLATTGDTGDIGIAMSANVAGQYGWYQVVGKAIAKALAGYVDNALVYLTATAGSIDDAVIDGNLVVNAKGASAVGTPSTGLAEFEIDRPFVGAAGQGAVASLTDNSGGAAADGTIGAITVPTAITDNSGAAGADGTIGVVTVPTAITDGTMAGTANGAFETIGATNAGDVSGAIMNNFKECQSFLTSTVTAITACRDAVGEITARQAENRTAITAARDAVKELSTTVNNILTALRNGGVIAT